mgnify:CR=1 FL=1
MVRWKSTPFFNFFYFYLFYFLYLHLMQFCSVFFLFLTANFWSGIPGCWCCDLHCWGFAGRNRIFFFSSFLSPFSLFIIWKQAGQFPDQPEKNLIHNKFKTLRTSTTAQPAPLQAPRSADPKSPGMPEHHGIRQLEVPHSAQWQRPRPVCWRTGETLPLPVLLTGRYRYWSAQLP